MQAWLCASNWRRTGEIHTLRSIPIHPLHVFTTKFDCSMRASIVRMEETVESYAASESFDFSRTWSNCLYYLNVRSASIQALMTRVARWASWSFFMAKAE